MSRIKNPKSNARRTDEHQERARMTEVSRLYVRGRTQASIALELGMSSSAVQRLVTKIEEEWKAERLGLVDEYKAREMAKLQAIEEEAWEQWERSKQNAVEEHSERSEDDGAVDRKTGKSLPKRVKSKASRTEKGQCGDPRYLQVLNDVREKVQRLVGVTTPKITLPGSGDGDGPKKGTGVLLVPMTIENAADWSAMAVASQSQLPGAK